MRTDDLPESNMVADRRGKKEPQTLAEHIEQNSQEPQPERGQPDPTSDLAKSLGVDQIGKVVFASAGFQLGFLVASVTLT